MAKPRLPKKTSGVKETILTPTSSTLSSDTNLKPEETLVAATTTENRMAEPRKPARKPEIVKSESRTNVVPINVEDEIRRLAYLLSERRGFEPGHEAEDWLVAEREIRQRYHQQSA
jgi:hypothetical protein